MSLKGVILLLILFILCSSSQILMAQDESSDALVDKGNNFYTQGKYDEAKEYYIKAIKADTENYRAWGSLGNIWFVLKDYEKSVKCYTKVLELNPGNAHATKYKEEALSKMNSTTANEKYSASDLEQAITKADLEKVKEIVKECPALLKKKANPSTGISFLQVAVSANSKEIVEALLTEDCDVNEKDYKGNTALHTLVIQGGDLSIAELLVSKNMTIDTKNQEGYTPLQVAATLGNKKLVAFLVAKGADVNNKAKNGMSVLHDASAAGVVENVEFFISRGAEVNALDAKGNTPYDYATSQEIKDMINKYGGKSGKDK
jgi:tetratricopeptide (TPR) repeat protein